MCVVMSSILHFEGAIPQSKWWGLHPKLAKLGRDMADFLFKKELEAEGEDDDYSYLYTALLRECPRADNLPKYLNDNPRPCKTCGAEGAYIMYADNWYCKKHAYEVAK